MVDLSAHHIGITFQVGDLEDAIDYYSGVLGLDVAARVRVSGESLERAVNVPNAEANVAHMDADGIFVELIEYEPEGSRRSQGAINEPGFKHLAFETTDIDDIVAELPDDTTMLSQPTTLSSGTRVLFFRDPWGNLIELVEGFSTEE